MVKIENNKMKSEALEKVKTTVVKTEDASCICPNCNKSTLSTKSINKTNYIEFIYKCSSCNFIEIIH
jgi:transcription elongation factor Elf1